eukprot:TRINITY_DN17602_c0_g1_i1.p1 TRINITY_DN17602_c0_g1~~TRINITY_DN17602_c0_g1_i1.p1  ORF type:complete len:123 (+),score=22.31 TRINITY_DN17602_c0_g1_i1:98-466(+)
MIVPFYHSAPSGNEWVLIELQGEVEPTVGRTLNSHPLGKLTTFEGKDRVVLTIGHHDLEGKKVKLDRPLALATKERTRVSSTPNTMEIVGAEDEEAATETSYHVSAIVKYKYLFKSRPNPSS